MRGNLKQAKEFYTQAVELGDPGEIAKISLDELPKEDSIPPTGPENNWYMNPPEALNQKGEIFAHYGMYQRAVNLYSMALRMDPNNLNSKLNTAMAYFGDKQFNRAIAILEKHWSHTRHIPICSAIVSFWPKLTQTLGTIPKY